MLWAILNKSWKQNCSKQQLYGHLPPISQTIQVRWTKHGTLLEKQGWTHKWHSSMDPFKWTCWCLLTSKNLFTSTLTQNLFWKTCQELWMIGMDGEREKESRKFVQAMWLYDDDVYICKEKTLIIQQSRN